jgi:large subunit ribosomal protein L6
MKHSVQYTRYLEIVGVGYKAATILDDSLSRYKGYNDGLRGSYSTVGEGALTEPVPYNKGKVTLLQLKLGFSHDVLIEIPLSVRVFCFKPTLICCVGTNKNVLTQFAAQIRDTKPPEIYKGKGIRYRNEVIMHKQGKKK